MKRWIFGSWVAALALALVLAFVGSVTAAASVETTQNFVWVYVWDEQMTDASWQQHEEIWQEEDYCDVEAEGAQDGFVQCSPSPPTSFPGMPPFGNNYWTSAPVSILD